MLSDSATKAKPKGLSMLTQWRVLREVFLPRVVMSFRAHITRTNGGKIKVDYTDNNFRPRYIDEYTGEVLTPSLIRAAIVEELNYFNDNQIWQLKDLSKVKASAEAVHVRTRWVLCNKGDASNPDMRARLVACGVNKTGKEDEFYASTPPGEAKQALFSMYASRRNTILDDGTQVPMRLNFIDIKKAYFNGVPSRLIYMSLPPELGLPKHFVAKQTRCVYGTRDAGMIWEQCYRDALEHIGFSSGVSNPCLFHHAERDIAVVVHGDYFTAMATDTDLDWYTSELQKVFEIKVRGRIGERTEETEVRILNRIVHITPTGVRYEADPRHHELLVRSMGLEAGSSVITPGIKPAEPETSVVKGEEMQCIAPVMDSTGRMHEAFADQNGNTQLKNTDKLDESILVNRSLSDVANDTSLDSKHKCTLTPLDCKQICAVKREQDSAVKRVTLNDTVDYGTTMAYSTIYGTLPKLVVATAAGTMKAVSNTADHYTGKSAEIMRARIIAHALDLLQSRRRRNYILRAFLSRASQRAGITGNKQGPTAGKYFVDHYTITMSDNLSGVFMIVSQSINQSVGMSAMTLSDDMYDCNDLVQVSAVRTPSTKNKFKARQGAKAVKKLERLESASETLIPDEAKTYRALSARANYLAQDRPDVAFSTKELCREFAVPTRDSYMKLKRVVRYLLGMPRLVYLYDWQEPFTHIDLFTDTDFAGCRTTRRSTSGGVAMVGTHCARHYSTTQSTISLSSGEAELHGISKGMHHAIGLRSMYKDLGLPLKLRVHSDATAAIGIARRRGLGKLRHLDCEDLWIQSKVRSKDVELLKVLGAENPADILTKYVDPKTLQSALKRINMIVESGRPASAPQGAKQ